MKVTVVPAQVTTIEDKIAGGLDLKQLVLLIIPVFLSAGVYAILPTSFSLPVYKMVIIFVLFAAIGTLAIKVKGVLLLSWLLVRIQYASRPRFYVYDKCSLAHRAHETALQDGSIEEVRKENTVSMSVAIDAPTTSEHVAFEALLHRSSSKLHFKTDKKGNLHVAISKAE